MLTSKMQSVSSISLRYLLRNIKKVKPITPLLIPKRMFNQTSVLLKETVAPGKLPPKLANLQKQFQKNDGKPVFLKGKMDNILYRLTWLLCFVGMLGNVWLYAGYII